MTDTFLRWRPARQPRISHYEVNFPSESFQARKRPPSSPAIWRFIHGSLSRKAPCLSKACDLPRGQPGSVPLCKCRRAGTTDQSGVAKISFPSCGLWVLERRGKSRRFPSCGTPCVQDLPRFPHQIVSACSGKAGKRGVPVFPWFGKPGLAGAVPRRSDRLFVGGGNPSFRYEAPPKHSCKLRARKRRGKNRNSAALLLGALGFHRKVDASGGGLPGRGGRATSGTGPNP